MPYLQSQILNRVQMKNLIRVNCMDKQSRQKIMVISILWVRSPKCVQILQQVSNVVTNRPKNIVTRWNFKVIRIICCGYSKLVSRDAWHNEKGISSTSITCRNIGIFWSWPEIAHFGRFLQARWSDWADSFCIVQGVSRQKFRVPTSYNFKNFKHILEIWHTLIHRHSMFNCHRTDTWKYYNNMKNIC